MDIGDRRPHHAERLLEIDGERHSVFRGRIAVAELYDLTGKSPDEWQVQVRLEGGDAIDVGLDDELELHEGRIAYFRMLRRGHHPHTDVVELTIVVASDPVRLLVPPSTPLREVVREALAKANAVGREREDWELKTEAGEVLDLSLTLLQAGIACGATLFLSLKAGAAGEVSAELLVDPAVSTAKFNAELAAFRATGRKHARRGIWLVRDEFPEVVLVFAAPKIAPLRMIAFGAVLDFSNYDLWAPSVRIVDPFTEVPYKGGELPAQAQLMRRTGREATGETPEIGRFMVWQDAGEVPFLCHPGVREYHAHPAHTGDSWLLHRARGEGTLSRIVELLFQYGSAGMVGLNVVPAIALPPA